MTDQPKPTPCPFCGEQPELHKHNDQGGKVYIMFGCFSNACPTEACYIDGGYSISPSADEISRIGQYLTDMWNAALIARAPELQQRVDELTADLADHKQLLVTKNRQLDTMTADNQRLRELLRECHEQMHKLVCVFVSDQDGAHKQTCDLMRTVRDQLGMSHMQEKP